MVETLVANPLLLLFLVAAIGYPLGRVRVRGFSLGVAAVLFVGLAFGALDPRLGLSETVYQLGLVLFIYTVGLASGKSFFASFRRGGLRDNLLVFGLLLFAGVLTVTLYLWLGFSPATTAGMFAGSLTNTPALASVIESLRDSSAAVQAEPVVAYAVTYPVGVIGVLVLISSFQRFFGVDYSEEALALRDLGVSGEHLRNVTVRVTRADIGRRTVGSWREREGWGVILGRFRRGDVTALVHSDTYLQVGDEVSLIGGDALEAAAAALGEVTDAHLEFDRRDLDFRRVFVSSPQVADKTLAQLRLPERFGALLTRVRRGDVDQLPTGSTRLELGDRVRVVARRERLGELTAFFGDSYRALAEIDILVLGTGIALGLLIGLVPVPLPGGLTFRLGLAGGPLLVALCLGALGRSGPVVWTLPYGANLTLRQFGLVLFLAGVGTRSGYAFVTTLSGGQGVGPFLAGAAVTFLTAALTLLIGYKGFKIPLSLLIGMLAGLQTQPAVLGFATEQTRNDLPNIGYATVFPLATIVKILLAQLLLTGLGQAR